MECSELQRDRSGSGLWLNLSRVPLSRSFGRNRSQISCFGKPRVANERDKLDNVKLIMTGIHEGKSHNINVPALNRYKI